MIVHRGRRLADNTPVLIKSPRSERPSRPAIARLRREQAILATLDDDRITRALELVPSSRGVALILEDIGGETLRRRCDEAPLACAAFLDLALRITDALAALHSHGIAHRNLSPETILFEPGGRVSLTDFGVAGPSASAEASAGDVELSFAYVAPEQTGRLNRPVDQRSDLYSLGVVFFELMTGRPPFQHEDRLELVHSHIAREPPSPRALNPECPEAVAAIILKLLAKMADERYQSADGLRHDLERCRERLGKDGAIAPFALGEHDRPPRLTFTDRLYGSEGLIHEFLAAFERASKGTREVVLFEGQTGAGKSQLLAEILHGHVAGRGQVLSARCDSDPDTPYAPLVAALRGRLRELLSADDDELDLWRMQLAAAVGDGAALL
ncbi:MAG: protein kinase, partial [Myxococcales bacterium]|nr:protein kinase [Myxococcales bacterium]